MEKKEDPSQAKRKEGALIHVKASGLHSKNSKSELNCSYGVHHSSKTINRTVLCAIWIRSERNVKRCHLVCQFNKGGNDVERTIHVGQVHFGHKDVDPYTNPLYCPPPTPTAAAALIAHSFITSSIKHKHLSLIHI